MTGPDRKEASYLGSILRAGLFVDTFYCYFLYTPRIFTPAGQDLIYPKQQPNKLFSHAATPHQLPLCQHLTQLGGYRAQQDDLSHTN